MPIRFDFQFDIELTVAAPLVDRKTAAERILWAVIEIVSKAWQILEFVLQEQAVTGVGCLAIDLAKDPAGERAAPGDR